MGKPLHGLFKTIFNLTVHADFYVRLLINPVKASALIRPFSTKAFRAVNN